MYYWMEYDPAVENTLGANYYIPNKTFLGGQLSDSNNNGRNATFSSQNAGTVLRGMVDSNLANWEYLGTVSVAQVQGDSNLLGNAPCFTQKGYTGDAKFQYQLKQVFADADGSGNLVIYRSQNPHSYAYGNPIYLRSENGWQYTWTNLNRDNQWSVQEVQVLDGYQVSVSYVGTVWTITNTKGDTPDKPNRPDTPDKPDTPDTPNLPDTPTQPDQLVTPDRPDQPSTPDRTPKTGDETHLPLWLTLMGTSLVGLIFSVFEIRKTKRNKHIR